MLQTVRLGNGGLISVSIPFTIAVLPDTQEYVKAYPHIFTSQTKWIVNNIEKHNIVFVLHEGDITDNNSKIQWGNASKSMGVLDGLVPYALVTGNHDMGVDGNCESRNSLFNQYFPSTKYASTITFGGVFESKKMENTYHLFEQSETGWLILALEFLPRNLVLEWANDIATTYQDRKTIVLTHSHLRDDNTLHGSDPLPADNFGIASSTEGANDGIDTWKKLIRNHRSMSLVFSGHYLGAARVTGIGNSGNKVFQLLSNYQGMDEGGKGYLRLVKFYPSYNQVSVKTYSPYLNSYLDDDDNEFVLNQFDFK